MSVECREPDTDSPENVESVCPVTSQRVAGELDYKTSESLAFEFIVLPAIPNDQGAIIVTVRKNRSHHRRRFLNRWTRQITRLARSLKYRRFKHSFRTASKTCRKGEETAAHTKPNHLLNCTYPPLPPEERKERRKQIIVSLSWHAGLDSRENNTHSEQVQTKQQRERRVDLTSVKKTRSASGVSTLTRRLPQNFGFGLNPRAASKRGIDYCQSGIDFNYSSGDIARDGCVGYLKGASFSETNLSHRASVSVTSFTPWYLMQGDDCVQLNAVSSELTSNSSNITSLVVTYAMEDTQTKTAGEAGDSKQRKDHAHLYDPIYDFACGFAESHGYGFVVFVDDENKLHGRGLKRKRLSSKTTTGGTFLPHVPVEKDRRWPIHVVKYTSHSCETRRKKCQARPAEVRECVLTHMNLRQSAQKEGDVKKSIRKDRVKVEVKLPVPERSASVSSKKPQKRRSSSRGSHYPGPSGVSPSRPCSSSATKLCSARLGTDADTIEGKAGSPDSKYTSESLAAYRERLKQCSLMYEEQLMNHSGSTHSDMEPRKSAEGDATAMEINDQAKMAGESPTNTLKLRPANNKVKSKQKEVLSNFYLVAGNEENLSRNHALEDDNVNTVEDEDDEQEAHVTSSLPRLCDKTSKQYKLYNSISATIFRESQLAQRNFGESEKSEALPLAKIDFVRVKDSTVKKKHSGIHVSQELYHAVRHHFKNVPRKMKPLYGALSGQSLGRVRCSQHLTSGAVQICAAAINSDIFRHTRDGEKSESCPNLSLRQMHCERGLQELQHKRSPIMENSSLLTIGDSLAGAETSNEAINETMTPAWGDCITVDGNELVENSVVKASERENVEKSLKVSPTHQLFENSALTSFSTNIDLNEHNDNDTSPMKGMSPENLSSPEEMMAYLDSQPNVNSHQCEEEPQQIDALLKDVPPECHDLNNNALPDKAPQCQLHPKDGQMAQEVTIRTLTTSPTSAGQGEDGQSQKHVNVTSGKNMDEYLRLPVLPQRSRSTTNNGQRLKVTCDTWDVVAQIPPVPRTSCIIKNPSPMTTKSSTRKESVETEYGQSSIFSTDHSVSSELWLSGVMGKHNKRRPPRLSPVPCKSLQHPILGNINGQGDNVLKEKPFFVTVPKLDAYNQVKLKHGTSLVGTPRNPESGDDPMQFSTPTKNDQQEPIEPSHSDFVFLLPIEEHKSLIEVKQCTGKREAEESPTRVHSSEFSSKQKQISTSSNLSAVRSCQDDKIESHSQEVKEDKHLPSLNFSNTSDSENNNNNALDGENLSSQDSYSHHGRCTNSQFSFTASVQKSKSFFVLFAEKCSENQNSNASSSTKDKASDTYSNCSTCSNLSESPADCESGESFEKALGRELEKLKASENCSILPPDNIDPRRVTFVPNVNTSNITKRSGRCCCSETSGRGIHESSSKRNTSIRNKCARNSKENLAMNDDQVAQPLSNLTMTGTPGPSQDKPANHESNAASTMPLTSSLNGVRSAISQPPLDTLAQANLPHTNPQTNHHSEEFRNSHGRGQTLVSRNSTPYCPTTENYWETAAKEPFIKLYVPEYNVKSCSYDQFPNGCLNRQLSDAIKNWRIPAAFTDKKKKLSPEARHSSGHKVASNIALPQNTQSVLEPNKPLDSQLLHSGSNYVKCLEDVARTAQEGLQSFQRLLESKLSLFKANTQQPAQSDQKAIPDEQDAIHLSTEKTRSRGANRNLPLNVSKYNNENQRQLTEPLQGDGGVAGEEFANQDNPIESRRSDPTFPTIQFNEVKTFTYDTSGVESVSPELMSSSYMTVSQETLNSHGSVRGKTKTGKNARRSAVAKSSSRGLQRGTRRARRRNRGCRGRHSRRSPRATSKSIRGSKQEMNNPVSKHCCKGRNGNSRYLRAQQSRACRRRQMMDGGCCSMCLPGPQPSGVDIVYKQRRGRRKRTSSRRRSRSSGALQTKKRNKMVKFRVSSPARRRKQKKLGSPELLNNCRTRHYGKHCSACKYRRSNYSALRHSRRNRSGNNLNNDAESSSVSGSEGSNESSVKSYNKRKHPTKRGRKETRYVIGPKGHRALYEIAKRRNEKLLGTMLRIGEGRAKQQSKSQVDEIVRRFRRIISQFPTKRLRSLEQLIISKDEVNRPRRSRRLAVSDQSPSMSRKVLSKPPDSNTNTLMTWRQARVDSPQPHASSAESALTRGSGYSRDGESLGQSVPANNVFRRPGLYFFNTQADHNESPQDTGSVGEVTPSRRATQPRPVDSLNLIRKKLSKDKNSSRNDNRLANPTHNYFNFVDLANSSEDLSWEESGDDSGAYSSGSYSSCLNFDPGSQFPSPSQFGLNGTTGQIFFENIGFSQQYHNGQSGWDCSSEGFNMVSRDVSDFSVATNGATLQNNLLLLLETFLVGESNEIMAFDERSSRYNDLDLLMQGANHLFNTDRLAVVEKNQDPSETVIPIQHVTYPSCASLIDRVSSEIIIPKNYNGNPRYASMTRSEPSETNIPITHSQNPSWASMTKSEPSETNILIAHSQNPSCSSTTNRVPTGATHLSNHDECPPSDHTLKGEVKCSSSCTSPGAQNSRLPLSVISENVSDATEVRSRDGKAVEDDTSSAGSESHNKNNHETSSNGGPSQPCRVINKPHFTPSLWKGFERAGDSDLDSGKPMNEKQRISPNYVKPSCFKVPAGCPVKNKKMKQSSPLVSSGSADNMDQFSVSSNQKTAEVEIASGPDVAGQDDFRETCKGGEESNELNSRESLEVGTTQQQATLNWRQGLGQTESNALFSLFSEHRASQNECLSLAQGLHPDYGVGNISAEYPSHPTPTSSPPDPVIYPSPEHIFQPNFANSQHLEHTNIHMDMLLPQQETYANPSEENTMPLVISPQILYASELTKEHRAHLDSPTTSREEHEESMSEDHSTPQNNDLISKQGKDGSDAEDLRHVHNQLTSHDNAFCCQESNPCGATSLSWETQLSLTVNTPGISTTWHCTVPKKSDTLDEQMNNESETRNAPQNRFPRSKDLQEAHCSKDFLFDEPDEYNTGQGRNETIGDSSNSVRSSDTQKELYPCNPTAEPEEMSLATTGNTPIKESSGSNPSHGGSYLFGPRTTPLQNTEPKGRIQNIFGLSQRPHRTGNGANSSLYDQNAGPSTGQADEQQDNNESSESNSQVFPSQDDSKENNNNAIKSYHSFDNVTSLPSVSTAGHSSQVHPHVLQFGLHGHEQQTFNMNATRSNQNAFQASNLKRAPQQCSRPWRKRCADWSLPAKMAPPTKMPRLSPKTVLSQHTVMRRARFALMKELRYMKERQERRERYKHHHGTVVPVTTPKSLPSDPTDADGEAST